MLTKLCLAILMTISLAGAPKAKVPAKITRESIIQSSTTPLSVQERAAFNATKTRLEAALMLQSLYQSRHRYWDDRYDALKSRPMSMRDAEDYQRVTGRSYYDDVIQANDNRYNFECAEDDVATLLRQLDKNVDHRTKTLTFW